MWGLRQHRVSVAAHCRWPRFEECWAVFTWHTDWLNVWLTQGLVTQSDSKWVLGQPSDSSGSWLGQLVPPLWGHLAVCGDMFGCHIWGEGVLLACSVWSQHVPPQSTRTLSVAARSDIWLPSWNPSSCPLWLWVNLFMSNLEYPGGTLMGCWGLLSWFLSSVWNWAWHRIGVFFDSVLERTRAGLNSVIQTFSPFLITVSTSDRLLSSQETTWPKVLLSYSYRPGFLAFLVGQSLSRVRLFNMFA